LTISNEVVSSIATETIDDNPPPPSLSTEHWPFYPSTDDWQFVSIVVEFSTQIEFCAASSLLWSKRIILDDNPALRTSQDQTNPGSPFRIAK